MAGLNSSQLGLCALLWTICVLAADGRRSRPQLLQIDRNCSIMRSDDAPRDCTVRKITNAERKRLFHQERAKRQYVPKPPRNLQLIVPDDPEVNDIQVVWIQPAVYVKFLTCFLLTIQADAVTHSSLVTQQRLHFQVCPSPARPTGDYLKFGLQLKLMSESVKLLAAEVTSLPHSGKPVPCKSAKVDVDKGARLQRQKIENCMCRKNIQAFLPNFTEEVFSGTVIVTKLPPEGRVNMQLVSVKDDQVFKVDIAEESVSGDRRELRIVAESPLLPGLFKLQITRTCPKHWPRPDRVQGCHAAMVYEEVVNINQPPRVAAVSGGPHTLPQTNGADWQIVMISAISVVSLAGVVILGTGIVRALVAVSTKRQRLESTTSSCDDGTSSLTALIMDPPPKTDKCRVAIIYTCDSVSHRQSVYWLQETLSDVGIDVTVVDEAKSPEMWGNWIDFTERLADTHRDVLFVVSAGLYRMCHEYRHGKDEAYRGELDQNNGQCVPVVMLNSLRVQSVRSVHRQIRTHAVSFEPEGRGNSDLLKLFVADHRFLDTSSCSLYHLVGSQSAEGRTRLNSEALVRLVKNIRGSPTLDSKEKEILAQKIMKKGSLSQLESCVTSTSESLRVALPAKP